MKLSKLFIAAIALVAAVACTKEEEKDTTPAELRSFAFLAEDNAGVLEKDYEAVSIAPEMIVRIPDGGKGRKLVARLTMGENDTATADGAEVVGGKVTVDGTYPIDIIVTNSKSGLSSAYVVKVGKILTLVPTLAATYEEPGAEMYKELDAAINPKTNQPYFFYTRKTIVDGKAASRRIASMVKWNGTSFDAVGNLAFTGEKANPSGIGITFDGNGTPTVVYQGGQASNLVSAMSLSGADWALLGDAGSAPRAATTYYPNIVSFYDGNTLNVLTQDYAGTKTTKYKGLLSTYNGASWSFKELEGGPEIGGEGHGTSAGLPWAFKSTTTDNGTYVANVYNEHYATVRKFKGGNIEIVADKFVPAGENMTLPGAFCCDSDKDGNVYVTLAKWNAGQMQLYKLNEETKSLEEVAQPIKVTISASGGVSEEIAFGINKATGEMVLIATDANDVPQLYLMSDTGKWSEPISFTEAVASSNIHINFNANGEGFISFISKDLKLTLFTLGREEDVLPE